MARPRPPQGPEAVLVRRAQRIVTAQIAGIVTLLVAVAGVVAYIVLTRDQSGDNQRQLAMATMRPMLDHPPAHAWEFRLDGAALSQTGHCPAGLPVRTALNEVAATRKTLVTTDVIDGVSYLVRTQAFGGGVIQVALDLEPQEQEREELYAAVAFFEIVGLAAAAVTGRLLSRRAIAPLGVAMERQSRFVADASHELRTPLTQLHTRAQLLQHRLSRDSGVTLSQEELDGILASTRQFGEVIEDVLRSAQARDEPGLRTPVNLPAIVTGVAEAESARAEAAGVSLSVTCEAAACDVAVAGVGPALRRAVAALVDNALTHTPGGGHIEISLACASGAREVEICVRDDGAGFPPDDAARIFDRAQRGDDAGAQGQQRFGIGLALVREIIESHGGRITASGQPGQGACFAFRLPCAGPSRPSPPRPGLMFARRLLGGFVGGYMPKHSTD
jgi:signal transduction histidine kinase